LVSASTARVVKGHTTVSCASPDAPARILVKRGSIVAETVRSRLRARKSVASKRYAPLGSRRAPTTPAHARADGWESLASSRVSTASSPVRPFLSARPVAASRERLRRVRGCDAGPWRGSAAPGWTPPLAKTDSPVRRALQCAVQVTVAPLLRCSALRTVISVEKLLDARPCPVRYRLV